MAITTKGCPECRGSMVVRTRRSDGRRFLGCVNYPRCKGTRNIPESPEVSAKARFKMRLIADLAYSVVHGRMSMVQAKKIVRWH